MQEAKQRKMTGKLISCLENCISFASSVNGQRSVLLMYLLPPSGEAMSLTETDDVIHNGTSNDQNSIKALHLK